MHNMSINNPVKSNLLTHGPQIYWVRPTRTYSPMQGSTAQTETHVTRLPLAPPSAARPGRAYTGNAGPSGPDAQSHA